MSNKIDKKVLVRFLKGNYTSKDYHQIREWFDDTKQPKELDDFIHENWIDFKEETPEKDLSFILEKIQSRLYKEEKKQTKTLWHYYRQIAAILILPILVYTAYLLADSSKIPEIETQQIASWAEIYSPPGARTQFMLPDGTSGWLNSGSSIQYPINFKNREVKIDGEAFFDVTHKGEVSFLVQTNALDIVVLGTKFNVAAYSEDSLVEVVLEQGKVRLEGKNNSFSESLSEDERFVFHSNQKKGTISSVDASIYSSWKDGKLVFRNEPFSTVLKRLGRWYNVSFDVNNEQLQKYIYQATFEDETLEEVMRLLAFTVPIEYQISNRKLNPNGTYSKRKVYIWKKKNKSLK